MLSPKPCLVCRKPTRRGARCLLCQQERDSQLNQQRGGATARGYTYRWQQVVRARLKEQPWCSVCGAQDDLTGDHLIPLAAGGTNEPNNCRILCRRCNSRKGARVSP